MIIDAIFVYLGLLALCALALLIVGIFLAYVNLVGRLAKAKTTEPAPDIRPLFKDTEARLAAIVENASASAKQTLARTQLFTQKQLIVFEEEVNKSSQMYLNLYQRTLENLERETVKEIKAIPELLHRDMSDGLKITGDAFKADVIKIAEEIRLSLEKAYKNVEIDVEEYKKARLSQVDKSLADIILQIARKVLVKEINREEHEKLVLKALEDAKKSGMFSQDI